MNNTSIIGAICSTTRSSCRPAWDDYARLTCRLEEQILKQLERTGPVSIQHPCVFCPTYRASYVEILLYAIPRRLAPKPDGSAVQPEQLRALRRLHDAMAAHRLPGVQILGRGGQLWADMRLGQLSAGQVETRLHEIVEFAKRKIADPGVEKPDAERAACYEAIVWVCDAIAQTEPAAWHAQDEMFDFMLSRKEVAFVPVFAGGGATGCTCTCKISIPRPRGLSVMATEPRLSHRSSPGWPRSASCWQAKRSESRTAIVR